MNTDSRTLNSTHNIVFGIFSKVLTIVLTFISRSIFIHVLSIDYLSINGLFSDILMMLSLADLGIGTAMAFSFYQPLADQDQEKIAALIYFYRKVYIVIAIAITVIGCGLTPFLPLIINLPEQIPHINLYYLVILGNTVASYLFIYKSTLVTADQKNYIISKYTVVTDVLKISLQTIILFLFHNYLLYLLVSIVCTLTRGILISNCADRLYPFIKSVGKKRLKGKDTRDIIENVKSVFLYKFSSILITGTDNIIISVIIGTRYVGLYSNYYTITYSLSQLYVILFSSITASIGNLLIKANEEKCYEVYKTMQMISFWISGVLTTCLFFLTEDFISLWVGKAFLVDKFTLIAILLNFYLSLSMQPIWSFREAAGLYKKVRYVMLVTAISNIIWSVLLGYFFGLGGVILATVISKLTTYFLYEPPLLYKSYFKKEIRSYYLGHLVNVMLTVLNISILLWISKLDSNGWFQWILKSFICFFLANILFILRYIKTKEFTFLFTKIKNIIKK